VCEKAEEDHINIVKKDFKKLNSETSGRIFLNFSLLPTDFQEISGFSKEIFGPEQVKKNVNLFH
jgi:hypothetical protein